MNVKTLRQLPAMLCYLLASHAFADAVVVIGHPQLPKLDSVTIQKLFTGKIIKIDGTSVTVVNAAPAAAVRARFLQMFLNQDEEKYVAYWTVRKFIGKGIPPLDLESPAEIIRFVQSHPGGIGYVDSADLQPGLNVLHRK